MGPGNSNKSAYGNKNKYSTTAVDNSSTPIVYPTLKDKPIAAEGCFARFGRSVDKAITGTSTFEPLGHSTDFLLQEM